MADLREDAYRMELLLTAMVDLLEEKGILTREELLQSAQETDQELTRLLGDLVLDSSYKKDENEKPPW